MPSFRALTPALPVTLALLWSLAAATGCKEKPHKTCPRYTQVRRVPAKKGDLVVAEVNGRPILGSEVAHRAQQDGLTKRQALQDLIDDELMVQEAERRGLQRDPEVVWAGKAAAIYALLRQGFEREYTRKDVSEAKLREVYEANAKTRFHRPEVRRFSHLFLWRPWHRRGRKMLLDVQKDKELRDGMRLLHKVVAAAAPQTWQQFHALEKLPEARHIQAKAQEGTFPRKELRKPFADALWRMTKPGQISEVVATDRWYHIIYLVQIIPGTNISYKTARPEILKRVWPHARRYAFKKLLRRVKEQCTIRTHPENLPVSPLSDEDDVAAAPRTPAPRGASGGH